MGAQGQKQKVYEECLSRIKDEINSNEHCSTIGNGLALGYLRT